MKNLKSIFITTLCIVSIISCKKSHDDHATPASTSINIISPTTGQKIEHMDTAHIKAEITSPNQLHGYTITLKRLADSTIVYTDDVDTHQNNFTITHDWVNNNTIHSDMLLTIDAVIDHSGNKISKSVQFHSYN
jgi:hypothetical protein